MRASRAWGDSSFMRAAANSMASGNPSRRTQISRDLPGVGRRQTELGLDCLHPLHKERDRGEARECGQRGKMCRIGQSQRWYRELVLGAYMQHLPARHQHLELRARRQEIRHLSCRFNDLFKVVQHQQYGSPLQRFHQTVR